ncbi:MAG: hypothetical protein IIZ24_00220 [Candidatus Methanomethylophilus sp.]|jgi:hypothetical protein|nr:hypothetical protein [Methanomethylophilus sp.]MBQ2485691.1 hypothetical protein [Methanomethylophilus sp.]MBQ4368643.1 hypothetical protein [Methanomethylophilus sp.]MBQ4412403.1 hypothetical protein [Methanomethylophilus sp.]MBQ5397028.1 hypothetical protein [Methanomethylophilus sp.]
MITVDDLTIAIENSIDSDMKLEHEEAFDLAQHVLNFFGYSNRIIDNVLEPEDRDAFYMLEDSGVLTTEREEITLYDGREWRIHYWLFKNEKIQDLINNIKPVQEEVVEETDLYKELPREAWIKHVEEDEE